MKKVIITCMIAFLIITGLIAPTSAQEVEEVIANQDEILGRFEKSDRVFLKLQIGNTVSYFHQRRIGEVIVEKDFIRYQFNMDTGELTEETRQWRSGLPEEVTPLIIKERAESMVEGEVQFTELYFISPESDIFPIEPPPENPCWIIRSIGSEKLIVTIIDAMTGEKLGYGIPPPYKGFSLNGPDWDSCDPEWWEWAENAEHWFGIMGYLTEMNDCPPDAKVQSHIQSDTTAMFYELAHGHSLVFHNECPNSHFITAHEVETWIESYASMPFTFLGSCDGMCNQTDNTLSHEFRKGSNNGTVAVGYCGMNHSACSICWSWSKFWQSVLFSEMFAGLTVQTSFHHANLAFPHCLLGGCMRIGGDTGLRVVPVVTRSLCGVVFDGFNGPLTNPNRDYYIRCDIIVPTGQKLTIAPHVDLAFMNNSKMTVNGTLHLNGSTGQIRFVSAEDSAKGMKVTGELKIMNGGEIKVYE